MKNINTLNEELNRMKSLMSEERLYGNLVEKKNLPLIGETNKGDSLIGKIKSLFKRKKNETKPVKKEEFVKIIKDKNQTMLDQIPSQYRKELEDKIKVEENELIELVLNDDWDDNQLSKEQSVLYRNMYGINGALIAKFDNLVEKTMEDFPNILGGHIDNTLEDLKSSMIKEGLKDKFMELLAKRNIIKKRGDQIEKGEEMVMSGEKSLYELAKSMKTTNLATYRNQLEAFVTRLMDIDTHSYLMNQKDCNARKSKGDVPKGGTLEKALKPTFGAIDDLVSRMYMDMKIELSNLGLFKNGEESKFTKDTAIEMLYVRYKNQKSLLSKIAKGIIKIAGGAYVSGQILNNVSKHLRAEYGSTYGGLLNSVLTDFLGGVAQISPDTSLTQCY